MLDSGGGGGVGFEVEPDTIAAGAGPLGSAAQGSTIYGTMVLSHASSAAGAAGEGPLAGVLGDFGAKVNEAASRLATSLQAAATALEATAQAYTQSDAALPGAP